MRALQLDGHKLVYHPRVIADFYDGKEITPIYAEISPTAFCNHRCVFCHYNHLGHTGAFPDGRMFTLIDELLALNVKSLVFAGIGEPLLHKETVSAITHARKQGLDVALSTNGVLLEETHLPALVESLTWIRFSCSGANQLTYGKIHATRTDDFNIVLTNIQKMVRAKQELQSNITIGIQYLLLPDNQEGLIDFALNLKQLGVDYFVVKHFYEHTENKYRPDTSLILDQSICDLEEAAKQISDEVFSFIVRPREALEKTRTYSSCYGLPLIAYIREDGEVYTCFSYQNEPKTSIGNILNQSFREIWHSNKKKAAIKFINSNIDKNKCQPNCRHHQANRYLWELKHPTIEHINFI